MGGASSIVLLANSAFLNFARAESILALVLSTTSALVVVARDFEEEEDATSSSWKGQSRDAIDLSTARLGMLSEDAWLPSSSRTGTQM
jgi:hypothetical protein